jgi:type IV secretory pathway TrbL component
MSEHVSTQIRLRRAFRYGYYAFVAAAGLALLPLLARALRGDLPTFPLPDASLLPMMALLVLALSVPLFFACWLIIGTAILRRGAERRSFTKGIAD